jgi:hypothetical protein
MRQRGVSIPSIPPRISTGSSPHPERLKGVYSHSWTHSSLVTRSRKVTRVASSSTAMLLEVTPVSALVERDALLRISVDQK